MTRRSFGSAVLCSAALLVGTLLGGATNLPRAQAKAPPPEQPGNARSQEPSPSKPKPPAGTVCKTTKDCPQDHVCSKVGDHKECTPTEVKMPIAPPVT